MSMYLLSLPQDRARAGNALVIAVGMLALVAATLALSTDGAISVAKETEHRTGQQAALAAVEGVLARKESMIVRMVNDGTLRTWTGGLDVAGKDAAALKQPNNYGVDYIGDCSIIWKIEPCRTVVKDVDPNIPTAVPFVVNPSPLSAYEANGLIGEKDNQYNYLFRIAAEAQLWHDKDADAEPEAKAQGVRYVAVTGEPLFRYVIYYAKEGPKGDLELSHGPGVNIRGGVYSAGAVYIGAGTEAMAWSSLNPYLSGTTEIGPDFSDPVDITKCKPVSLIGQNGIFRLSKPLMYAAFKGYASPSIPMAGNYESTGSFPADKAYTANELNPYRVHDSAGLATIGGVRTLNGDSILGVGPSANDSRDQDRPIYRWKSDSLPLFDRKARTRETGAPNKVLPKRLLDRPFEPQVLWYPPQLAPPDFTLPEADDPDNDIDEHLKAVPVFVQPDTQFTSALANSAKPAPYTAIEAKGQYLEYAIDAIDGYFGRRSPFNGWDIVGLAGNKLAPADNAGLIIRERPQPDFRYLTSVQDGAPVSWVPTYVPFDYGKHKRPFFYPFTPLYISDQAYNGEVSKSLVNIGGSINTDPEYNRQNYYVGGLLESWASCYTNGAKIGNADNDWSGFYRSNWRFIHFKAAKWGMSGIDMTDPSAYFAKDKFISAQFRLLGQWSGTPNGDPTGRKAGLMIRPFEPDASSPASGIDYNWKVLNSRKPYVAMLYSPERNFFTQRRLAQSNLANNNTQYTNSGVDGMGPPTARIYEVDPSFRRSDATSTITTWIDGMPGAVNINPGEGSKSFRVGPYSRTMHEQATASATYVIMRIRLVPPVVSGFIASDAGKPFNAANGGPVFSSNGKVQSSGIIDSVIDFETVEVKFSITPPINTTGPDYPTPDSSVAGPAYANTLWVPWSKTNGQWDEAALPKGGDGPLATALSPPNGPWTIAWGLPPNPPSANPPPLSAPNIDSSYYPDFGTAPGDPANPVFSVQRYPQLEYNSYISQRGAWYDSAPTGTSDVSYGAAATTGSDLAQVKRYLPAEPMMPLANYPDTSSFAPDAWTDSAPPVDDAVPATGVVGSNTAPWGDTQIPVVKWTVGDMYAIGVKVQHNGGLYECILDNTAADPGNVPGVSPTYWQPCQIWVRIEKLLLDPASDILVFKYYAGIAAPTPLDFVEVTDGAGTPSRANISTWGNNLLIGEAQQSGSYWTPSVTYISDITITQDFLGPDAVIDRTDWEGESGPGNPDAMTRYLLSQYQVFFGTQEITEDFFTYQGENIWGRLATEEVFYNPREFWSQSRWWNEGDPGQSAPYIEKETGKSSPQLAGSDIYTCNWRRMSARTTVLNLNMGAVQNYLKTRKLNDATADYPFISLGLLPASPRMGNATLRTDPLSDTFSGLIYVARTNRYPWNPWLSRGVTQENPFNVDLPNDGTAGKDNYCDLTTKAASPGDLTYTVAGGSDPAYLAPLSPPIKSVDFHHGVMLSNAAAINWEATGGGADPLGNSKLTIVTPNQLYVRGNLNSTKNSGKITPMAIMADCVTVLSNAWDLQGFAMDGFGVDGAGNLWGNSPMAKDKGRWAAPTTYNACIVTNNQPTTTDRVKEGQGAPFINTMLFIENWSNIDMNYTGSLVVLDTCRYTRAFLLEEHKRSGRSPMGTLGVDWAGGGNPSVPAVYQPANRNLMYNQSLRTSAGTPPFTPIASTTQEIGGWTRVTK
jgi:hypothetical protein